MHPNAAFRVEDRAVLEGVVRAIGFGKVFATTPDGPRVAHTPFFLTDDGALQFHLAKGNALTRHLAGQEALALVDGPDAYVSPDWYADTGQVPTWNYVAIEMQGPVRAMDRDGLIALLGDIGHENEARLAPKPEWTLDKADPGYVAKLLNGIVGFEMEIRAWRPTFKLHQHKDPAERLRVADALEAAGQRAMAHMMRNPPA